MIDVIELNPDFDNQNNHRIKLIQTYLQDNQLCKYEQWISNIIFYLSSRDPNIENIECIICFENILANNIAILVCGHYFHYTCIKKWKRKRNACPFCEADIFYKRISLPNRLSDNIDKILYQFNRIEKGRCKLNNRWFRSTIIHFDRYYLT